MAKKKKKSLRKKARAPAKPKPKKKAKSKTQFHPNCDKCGIPYDMNRPHECVPLTERDLLANIEEDLRDAFLTLRERAEALGEQRIYNNARAVMFSRRVCYMYVRFNKKAYVELCFFLPREEKDLAIHRTQAVSKTRFSHTFKLVHADQVEEPLMEWVREAYEAST